jgi:hypothetical protein
VRYFQQKGFSAVTPRFPKILLRYCLSVGHLSRVFALLFSGAAGFAQETSSIAYQIPNTSSVPQIDGVFDATEWGDALRVELTNETHPSQNVPAPVATEVYLMEDGEHFLVAFVAQDPEPDQIRAFYRDRDRAFQDDFVGFVIDTFNDERRAFEFFSNPLGVQMDLIQDDVARREDDSWNALWDSAGQINATGFVVEMRVPLKQLRFPSGLDKQTWGIDLLRFYPRDVRHRISNNTTDYSATCYLCLFKKAEGFANLEQRTNLQVIPTVTSRWTENRPKPATDSWVRDDPEFDGGVDVRWGINEDMILNATINPDFSQVEADQAQIDVNNTFVLFFPERREFFLDGAEYFNTNADLVYTRNISDPDYGVKLTGKTGNHTYAVMGADDQRTGFVIPGNLGSRIATIADTSSQDMAARYRYDFGRRLTMGTLLTARSADDYSNTVVSTDMNWQVARSDRVTAQLMRSDSEYPVAVQTGFNQLPELSDTAWQVRYNHQGQNFRLNANVNDYGKDFRADLGSINKVDYREYVLNPSYAWRAAPGAQAPLFSELGVWSNWNKSWDQADLELQEQVQGGIFFNGPWQSFGESWVGVAQRYYNGQYFDLNFRGFFTQFQPWAGAQFRINVNAGKAIDFANTQVGDNFSYGPGFTVQLGRHLQTQLNWNHQELDVAGGQLFSTNLFDVRLTYQFDNKSFVRAILIHSDTERNAALYRNRVDARSKSFNTQLLYSYRFNAQTRFFVGYSDAAMQDASVSDLEATNHTVFAKFSYAWQY